MQAHGRNGQIDPEEVRKELRRWLLGEKDGGWPTTPDGADECPGRGFGEDRRADEPEETTRRRPR